MAHTSPSPHFIYHQSLWGRAQRGAVAQLLLEDDGHGSSSVGGMAEGELTAHYPHGSAFLGSKGALLAYIKGIFKVCIYYS